MLSQYNHLCMWLSAYTSEKQLIISPQFTSLHLKPNLSHIFNAIFEEDVDFVPLYETESIYFSPREWHLITPVLSGLWLRLWLPFSFALQALSFQSLYSKFHTHIETSTDHQFSSIPCQVNPEETFWYFLLMLELKLFIFNIE